MPNCALTADYDPPRILVVVVMPGTHVATTVQIFIVREGGRKGGSNFRCFKPPKNWICIS